MGTGISQLRKLLDNPLDPLGKSAGGVELGSDT